MASEYTEWIEICTTTLDHFADNNRKPDLVKIDVEGAEELVIKGALGLIRSEKPPAWIIEIHSKFIEDNILPVFMDNGYTVSPIPSDKSAIREYPRHIFVNKKGKTNPCG